MTVRSRDKTRVANSKRTNDGAKEGKYNDIFKKFTNKYGHFDKKPETEFYDFKQRNHSRFKGNDYYIGQLDESDQKNGFGIKIYGDDTVYEGYWKAGKRHGRGRKSYVDGNIYNGDWVDDKKHGWGTFKYAKGG